MKLAILIAAVPVLALLAVLVWRWFNAPLYKPGDVRAGAVCASRWRRPIRPACVPATGASLPISSCSTSRKARARTS